MTLSAHPHQHGLRLDVEAGGAHFSLDARDAVEVVRGLKVARAPNAPAALDGVANVRGAILPIFSLACLLGLPDVERPTQSLVLVLAGGSLGLTVDRVSALHGGAAVGAEIQPLDLKKIAHDQMQSGFQTTSRIAAAPAAASAPAAPAQDVALLAFELAEQVYALPLKHISQVIPTSSVEATDASLRLVSMRSLLGLPVTQKAPAKHVIVVNRGGARAGFVVDRLTTVQRTQKNLLSPAPSILNRGDGAAHIESIYCDARGRPVSVLAPERLFADWEPAQPRGASGETANFRKAEAPARQLEQIVVLRLGDEEFGLPIDAIDEIVPLPDKIARLPHAPAFLRGVMNLRGRVIPVIDLKDRFGSAPERDGAAGSRRVVIIHVNDLVAGFIVDTVREILSLPAQQINAAPLAASQDPRTLDRVAKLDEMGRMILIIDPQDLLSRTERDIIADELWASPRSAAS